MELYLLRSYHTLWQDYLGAFISRKFAMTFVSISGIQKPVFQDITKNAHADDSLCLAFWAAVLFNFDIFLL